jgi:DNA-directed RNA polymerase subunit RPC12/RpoP
MIEIQLPCCEASVRVEALGDEIRCDACGIELTVAEDVPEPVRIAA